MWLCKNIFHIQVLVIYFFATPPIKPKLGQQIKVRYYTTNSIPISNHLDQSLWWANQKHWPEVRSYLVHSFLQVHIIAAAPCTTHRRVCKYIEPRLFSEPNRHIFSTFLHPILLSSFTYWALCGDAVMEWGQKLWVVTFHLNRKWECHSDSQEFCRAL